MTKPKSKWKRRSACDVVKGRPGPRLNADLVKNELEAFLLYINENLITEIVERNDRMRKVCKKNFCFGTVIQTKRKVNIWIALFERLVPRNQTASKRALV